MLRTPLSRGTQWRQEMEGAHSAKIASTHAAHDNSPHALRSTQILAINFHEADYLQAAQRNWYKFYFPDDYDFDGPTAVSFTVEDGVDALSSAVANYYAMNDISTDVYLYDNDGGGGDPPPPTLTVTSYSDIESLFNPDAVFASDTMTSAYTLNSTWLGPLDPSKGFPAQRAFFRSLVSMTLSLPPIRNFAFGPLYRNCYTWGISVTYDFSDRGQLELSMAQEVLGTCDVYESLSSALADKLLWINLLVIVLSALHSILILRAIVKAIRLMLRLAAWGHAQAEALRAAAAATGDDGAGGKGTDEGLNLSRSGGGWGSSSYYAPEGPGGGKRPPNPLESPDLGAETRGIRLSDMTSGRGAPSRGHRGPPPPHPGGAMEPLLMRGGPLRRSAEDIAGDVMEDSGDEAGGASAYAARSAAAAAVALDISWTSISWREWLKLVNGWAVLALAANALNITSCSWNINNRTAGVPTNFWHSLTMGGGVALLWLGVVRYVEHDRAYFNLILTLRRAAPRVLRFLVGVLPVFLGYSFFAVLLWGDRVPRFADPRTAFITLFANLNGDVVRETFMSLVNVHPITGQLFFYSFISLHIYVVLNIVIAVVEESYFITVAKTTDMAERAEEADERAKEAEAAARAMLHQREGEDAPQPPSRTSRVNGGGASGQGVLRGGGGGSKAPISRALSSAALLFTTHGAFDGGGGGGFGTGGSAGGGGGSSSSSTDGGGGTTSLADVAPKADSHSLKQRAPGTGSDRLATLLRLAEWDEVLTGERIGSSSASIGSGSGGAPSVGGAVTRPPLSRGGGTPTGNAAAPLRSASSSPLAHVQPRSGGGAGGVSASPSSLR